LLIEQISPTETPFLTLLGKTRAYNTYHEWLTDVMNATATSGDVVAEGESATNYALQDKTRYANYTIISDRVFTISGTEESISHYGLDSQYAYQLEKAMKELKIKIERQLLGASAASAGAAGTARHLGGAFKFAIDYGNVVSGEASTSALTESVYNDLLEDCFEDGGMPDTTFVNGWLKRRISSFQSDNQRTKEHDGKLDSVVDVYISDFGQQRIVLDRWCDGLANAEKGAGLTLEMDKWKIAYLRPPRTNPLAVDGDRKSVQILAEYTLEALAPTQIGFMSAFATASV